MTGTYRRVGTVFELSGRATARGEDDRRVSVTAVIALLDRRIEVVCMGYGKHRPEDLIPQDIHFWCHSVQDSWTEVEALRRHFDFDISPIDEQIRAL